eukprot:CAMPEP_0183708676 /NCGR_PEP_ID=MMETSP0737-20130205/4902_1 /TAXON_ID=385413 /ORGANISM="Thalassiosira miniscula, Strain CCMP1093" /LENGTH=277 /DNA_ID=CAMNT_0025936575 /DNA_START=493 /DNA_END=1326 /DNA_ORIENTATION=+
MISVEEAKSAIWDIVKSESFVQHKPSHGIAFVKTHKTGSSTITSVLHSIATSHNLVNPLTNKSVVYNPRTAEGREIMLNFPTTLPGQKSAPYDVWCNHINFRESLLTEAVPSSNGKYLSIVRDPGTRLRSACAFFKCCPANTEDGWVKFILSEKGNTNSWSKGIRSAMCRTDQSSREIFWPSPTVETQASMEKRVARGDLLLLVMERMIESMLVLWDFYKLHPLDVAFIPKKVKKKIPGVTDEKPNILKLAEEMVREANPYDTALHELANNTLTNKN